MANKYKITFAKSNVTVYWEDYQGTLLEFAEEHNVEIPFGDRSGCCCSCITNIISGEIKYIEEPALSEEEQKEDCLPCVAVPASDLVIEA